MFSSQEKAKRYYKERKWLWQPQKIFIFALAICLISSIIIFSVVVHFKTGDKVKPSHEYVLLRQQIHDESEQAAMKSAESMLTMLSNHHIIDHAGAVGPLQSKPLQSESTTVDAVQEKINAIENKILNSIVSPAAVNHSPTPIIVFTYNRAQNLRKTLESVFSTLKSQSSTNGQPTIYVSQDGTSPEVLSVINSYSSRIKHLQFNFQPSAKFKQEGMLAYYKIAQHYGWAMSQIFDAASSDSTTIDDIIILEDDIELSPDFFSYFDATKSLMKTDPTILCVSAWNDRGQEQFVRDPTQLYRTDVFPGLGWLLTRSLWTELKPKWPMDTGFWDDWLRLPEQTKGRSCIYPEMNRVHTFGEIGSSAGQFYQQFLKPIRLNKENINWNSDDMKPAVDRLVQSEYDSTIKDIISKAIEHESVQSAHAAISALPALPEWTMQETKSKSSNQHSIFKVTYNSLDELTTVLQQNGLMADHKAGNARASYKEILPYRYKGYRIFLIPQNSSFLT